jgi:hypothetical protein
MTIVVDGRTLGVAHNGVFTSGNTDPIPGGRLWSPAAWSWNDMRAAFIADGGDPAAFVPAGPASSSRTFGQQVVLKRFWTLEGHPEKAADPGTSNHGWGLAVDVLTRAAAAWILRHGARFGWSWDEGKRVGEWWHFRWLGTVKVDPLSALTRVERRRVRELDKLRRHKTAANARRRHELVKVLTADRKHVWHAANERHGGGWDARRRRERYAILKTRT